MYSYGPPHMAVQKQDGQHEHTFSSYVRIRDVVLKTYLGAMNDREEWRERVRDIRATSAIWWWWLLRFGLLAEIRWSVCMSESCRSLCALFSRTGAGLCFIPFVRMLKFKFLAHFSVDHLAYPVVSSLIFLLC